MAYFKRATQYSLNEGGIYTSVYGTDRFLAGLETEGVFRVNGNARLVENLRSSLNSENIQEVNLEQNADVISVASLLKLFLRELPGGVVPENATKEYVQEFIKNKKGLSKFLSS